MNLDPQEMAQEVRRAFSQALLEIRTERQMSQEALAAGAGLDRTTLSLFERGLRQPTLTTLLLLARELGIDPHELLARFLRCLGKAEAHPPRPKRS